MRKLNCLIIQFLKFTFSFFVLNILYSCSDNDSIRNESSNIIITDNSIQNNLLDTDSDSIIILENTFLKLKLSKSINTKQNEYYPVPNKNGSEIYFVGMDRTGQFSTKIDFTKSRDYGGEDIWLTKRKYGLYTEAVPLKELNVLSIYFF